MPTVLNNKTEEPAPGVEGIPAPRSVEETGLSFFFLAELVTKALFEGGPRRLAELSSRLKLATGILTPLIAFLRKERLIEVTGRGQAETDVTFALTEAGSARALQHMEHSQYAGATPVPLDDYVARVRAQSLNTTRIVREAMQRAFEGVVVRESILEQIGAGMNSGRAIVLYGPAGSGKTFIAERLVALLPGPVWVPYAVEVDNEVITVFDPLVHRPVQQENDGPRSLLHGANDPRWVLCQRPVVITGGELTLSMLDLDFDESSRYYTAPPQLKAANGLLIVDDLGRQQVSARELMNRWIVPLDRQIEYLSLRTGKRFVVPFDMFLVFSTNIAPYTLADEAFLRRLGYKIFIGPEDEANYRRIFEQVCRDLRIAFSEEAFRYLLTEHHYRHNKPLLACIPRDILRQVRDRAYYTGRQLELSRDMLDWAWNNYFGDGATTGPGMSFMERGSSVVKSQGEMS